jgi:hypothetical protein
MRGPMRDTRAERCHFPRSQRRPAATTAVKESERLVRNRGLGCSSHLITIRSQAACDVVKTGLGGD